MRPACLIAWWAACDEFFLIFFIVRRVRSRVGCLSTWPSALFFEAVLIVIKARQSIPRTANSVPGRTPTVISLTASMKA